MWLARKSQLIPVCHTQNVLERKEQARIQSDACYLGLGAEANEFLVSEGDREGVKVTSDTPKRDRPVASVSIKKPCQEFA